MTSPIGGFVVGRYQGDDRASVRIRSNVGHVRRVRIASAARHHEPVRSRPARIDRSGTISLPGVLDDVARSGASNPGEADAEFRRTIAEHLVAAGLTSEDVTAIVTSSVPEREATFRLLFPAPRLTATEFASQVGFSIDQLQRVRSAAGLPPLDPASDVEVFSSRDLATFEIIGRASAFFGEEAVLELTRVMGGALAQVAEAAVAIFVSRVQQPLQQQTASREMQFTALIEATQRLTTATTGLETLFRFHAEAAVRRLAHAYIDTASQGWARLAIGFVDLVGYTALSASIAPSQLNALVDDFERFAAEVIARHDARLVKLIGDAVMFAAVDADAACEIALSLVEHFADGHNEVTPRGALALGEMLVRAGDYYGPVVNLAARAGDLAVPHEVLVSEDIVRTASEAFAFEPAGRRKLKGFTEPVTLASLHRGDPRRGEATV
jgi:adenylate cyclase